MVCLFMLFSASVLNAQGSDNQYIQALDRFSKKDFTGGVKLYYKFLLANDCLLSAEYRKQDLAPAMDHFTGMIMQNATDPIPQVFLHLTKRLESDLEGATNGIEQLLSDHPKALLLWFLKGEFLLAWNKPQKAQEAFSVLKKAGKKKYIDLATMVLHLNRLGSAATPEARREFLTQVAFRRWTTFEKREAERVFRVVLEEFPFDPKATQGLIELLIELERPGDAIELLASWERTRKEELLAPLAKGRLWYSLGDYPKAYEGLSKALEEDPGNEYARILLAECAYQTNRPEEACTLFQQLHESDPENAGYMQRYHLCLEAQGKSDVIIEHFRQHLQENPNDVFARVELGALLLRTGDIAKAKANFAWLTGFPNQYKEYAEEMLAQIREKEKEAFANRTTTERTWSSDNSGRGSVTTAPSGSGGSPGSRDIGKTNIDELKRIADMYR